MVDTEKPEVSPAVDPKKEAIDSYNRVVEGARLVDIRMTSLTYRIRPEVSLALEEEREQQKPLTKKNLECMFEWANFDSEDGFLSAALQYKVEIFAKRKRILSIVAVYIIAYENVPPVEEVHALAFVQKVGRFAVYPFFRSIVSTLAGESRLDLPILPIMR
jgi:hypothetical protein